MSRGSRINRIRRSPVRPVRVGMMRTGVPRGGDHESDSGIRVHHFDSRPGGPVADRYANHPELRIGTMLPNPPASFPAGAGGWTASGAVPSSRAPLTRGGFGGSYSTYGGAYWEPYYYAGYYPWGPSRYGMPGRQDCSAPLSKDCLVLFVTKRWAIVCFMWAYNLARERSGDNLGAVTASILHDTGPCATANTEAASELRRRVRLAASVLMRGEGVEVPLPTPPNATRPPDAERYRQPWLRALMTGWV